MEELFEGLETVQDVDTSVTDVVQSDRPDPTSPEWNDYVLSLFEKNEMYDGRPLCHGLRRVAELLLGRIVSSRPTQIFAPQSGNEIGRATVVWELIFDDGSLFSDVADCWEGNTDDAFCVFNTATAATRAEGRALRKALRLRTVAAEEMTSKDTATVARSLSQTKAVVQEEFDDNRKMTPNQANLLNKMGSQYNIDLTKMFKLELSANPARLTVNTASDGIKLLHKYQADTSTIPDEILGFNEEWRG